MTTYNFLDAIVAAVRAAGLAAGVASADASVLNARHHPNLFKPTQAGGKSVLAPHPVVLYDLERPGSVENKSYFTPTKDGYRIRVHSTLIKQFTVLLIERNSGNESAHQLVDNFKDKFLRSMPHGLNVADFLPVPVRFLREEAGEPMMLTSGYAHRILLFEVAYPHRYERVLATESNTWELG